MFYYLYFLFFICFAAWHMSEGAPMGSAVILVCLGFYLLVLDIDRQKK